MIILITEEDENIEDLKGIVLDPERAKESPCTCYTTPDKKTKLCFSKAIIGALNKEQIEKYCPIIQEEHSVGLTEQQRKFARCSEEAKGLSLLERIQFMSECLKK